MSLTALQAGPTTVTYVSQEVKIYNQLNVRIFNARCEELKIGQGMVGKKNNSDEDEIH